MDIVVTGIGLRSALGNKCQTWHRLLLGESGIRMHQPFPELSPCPIGLLQNQPASGLQGLTQQVVQDAIIDAGLALPLPDCGVVIGSSRGNQTVLEQMLWAQRSEQDLQTHEDDADRWLDCLPNIAAVVAARLLQTQSIVLSPMAACATGIWAIARGCELIASGQAEQVLVGAVETPVTRLTLAGFEQMGALAKTGAYPFDRDREGLVLGEGGTVLLLESGRSAQTRSAAKIYGKILGFGLSADAHHLSSPQPDGRGAVFAIKQCLQQAQLEPGEIDYIHAHGTATQLNDATEAAIITKLFPQRPWVNSTKGATGHTLGASGALGVAFSLLALHHQTLPACIGLSKPNFDINLIRQTQTTTLNYALVNSFGFGGQNATIALAKFDQS